MKRFLLSAIVAGAMVASAAAQTGGGSGAGSASGSGSTTTGSGTEGGANSGGNGNVSATNDAQGSATTGTSKSDKTGKKAEMTGCITNQNGSYALVDKKHPNGVQLLSSEDLSAHVGHKVQVKGTWDMGTSSSSMSTTDSSSAQAKNNTGLSGSTASGDKSITDANVKAPSDQPAGSNSSASTTSTTSSSSSGSTPGAVTADTAAAVPNGDTSGSSHSNASALPQSDMGSMHAIRVSEIKMKSDKCDMPTSNNTTR